jgi:membrane protein implicated in regulation of membrane protease activity
MARDLRQYARQTWVRLIIGAILLIFIVGDGLIYIFYGRSAAVMGAVCLLLGLAPLLLIWIAMLALDFFVKRANRDEFNHNKE